MLSGYKRIIPAAIAVLFVVVCTVGTAVGANTQWMHTPHLVLAHYMPGFPALGIDPKNNYWYAAQYSPLLNNLTARPILYSDGGIDPELDSRIAEIRLAQAYGIDGFLVDELEDNAVYRQTWVTLLKAAAIVGHFKIGLQPDYATLGNPNGGDHPPQSRREKIKHWIDLARDSPALLRFDGKPCVIPYGAAYPDAKTYDQDPSLTYPEGEKKDLVDWMADAGTPISYAASHSLSWPIYTNPYANDPKSGFQTFAFATVTFSPGDNVNTMVNGINTRQRALNYWPASFMQIGEATFLYENPNAHWYTAPRLTTTWRQTWAWNVAHRNRIQWVEIITWNDWGESAVAPSVNQFMALQPITRYYADWFKTGVKPKITQDVVSIFHRDSPYKAVPTKFPMRINGPIPTDEVEALALLPRPATLVLQTGSKIYRKAVGAGVQSLIVPFGLGLQSAWIERHGDRLAFVMSPHPISDRPVRENLWIDGATSAYPPRSLVLSKWDDVSGDWTAHGNIRTGTGLSLSGNGSELGNVTVSADVTSSLATNGDFVGLAEHVNGDNYYRFALGHWDGKMQWRISLFDKGIETVIDHSDVTFATKRPIELRFDCVGEHLIGYVNGHLVSANAADYPNWQSAPLTYGRVGVTSIGTVATFANIRLKTYDTH